MSSRISSADVSKNMPRNMVLKHVAGAKPWFERLTFATPCATQNEINEEAAKALVANICYL